MDLVSVNLIQTPSKTWGIESYSYEVCSEMGRIMNLVSYYEAPWKLITLIRSFRDANAFLQSYNMVPPYPYCLIEFLINDWAKVQEAALQFAVHANIELHTLTQDEYYRGVHRDKTTDVNIGERAH